MRMAKKSWNIRSQNWLHPEITSLRFTFPQAPLLARRIIQVCRRNRMILHFSHLFMRHSWNFRKNSHLKKVVAHLIRGSQGSTPPRSPPSLLLCSELSSSASEDSPESKMLVGMPMVPTNGIQFSLGDEIDRTSRLAALEVHHMLVFATT